MTTCLFYGLHCPANNWNSDFVLDYVLLQLVLGGPFSYPRDSSIEINTSRIAPSVNTTKLDLAAYTLVSFNLDSRAEGLARLPPQVKLHNLVMNSQKLLNQFILLLSLNLPFSAMCSWRVNCSTFSSSQLSWVLRHLYKIRLNDLCYY